MHKIIMDDDMEEMMNNVSSKIQKAAKKSDSEILKTKANEMMKKDDPEIMNKCRMVRMLVDEGLDMYECGDMEFKDMVEDLYKALKVI